MAGKAYGRRRREQVWDAFVSPRLVFNRYAKPNCRQRPFDWRIQRPLRTRCDIADLRGRHIELARKRFTGFTIRVPPPNFGGLFRSQLRIAPMTAMPLAV